MHNVYILGGLRSYIGIKNRVFKNILPEKLGAEVLRKLIIKYNLHDKVVDLFSKRRIILNIKSEVSFKKKLRFLYFLRYLRNKKYK